MKSSFKSKINRLLKFLGFNVVKAKRPRAKKTTFVWKEITQDQAREELLNSGKTHYVGDDCPGGHGNWETAGGTTPEQNEAREFPKQPSSDNGISGPTS